MIIPLSHDSGEVRRHPWVTYGILLSCALTFLVTHVLQGEVSGHAERLLEDTYAYWRDHPYLEAAPRLSELTGDPGRAAREEFHALWEATGQPPVPAPTIELQQEEFDELTARTFAALEQHPWYRFGLIPSAPTLTGLFAHMFLHGGWLHLIPNLFFLFLTGPFIEDRWGRGLYLLFYLAAGVAGAALFVAKHPQFAGPLIGASGAIAGAMGAFLVRFARTNIKFFYWLGFFFGTFSAPAWIMLPLWFANEFLTAALIDAVNPAGGGNGVAYWAHVGGFGFGVIAALVFRFSRIEDGLSRRLGGGWTLDRDSVQAQVAEARAEGRTEEALELLRIALEADPQDPALALAFFDAAARLGRVEEGVALLAPVLWREVRAGEREAAVSHWLALSEASADVRAEPESLLRLSGWLRDANRVDAASLALQRALDAACGDPVIAMRVARLARSLDAGIARDAAEIALKAAGIERAERAALEAIVAAGESPTRQPDRQRPSPAKPETQTVLDYASVDLERISQEWRSVEKDELAGAPAAMRRSLRVIEVVPRKLDEEAIWLDSDVKGRTRLLFSRVDAVAAAGVHGLSRKAVILIDLILDWTAPAEKPLTVLRLRSDRYDPRSLTGGAGSPLTAIGALVSTLLSRTRAVALPDSGSARGEPFRIFRDIASYEEQVLGAERPRHGSLSR